MEDFTHAVAGHYHTPTSLYINDVRVWVNGSTESYNSYAQEQLASMGRPSQFCLFVKPDKGVTAEYLVNLEEQYMAKTINVKAVEFAGVGTIPKLLIEQDGKYEQVLIKVGITHIDNVKLEEE